MKLTLSGLALSICMSTISAQERTEPSLIPTLQSPAAQAGADQHGLPGAIQGTERWIIHFETRPFDLSTFRSAIYSRRPANEVDQIVRDLEAKAEAHQRAFVQKIQQLGGQLHAQWWLINACAIDVPHKALAEIAALPNVARIEADALAMPVIRTATNSSNHNSDYVNASLNVTGQGVTAAIVDTGVDVDVAGQGRPHRTYFPNGDPNNTSGSGIGGSRLVVATKIGALAIDDQHGHGTSVSSIVAGGNWGTSQADHGHAYGASVAGYSIANQVQGGGSSSSTMASAWQRVAADRAQHNIVSGNLSYGGSPSATNSAQIALDSAAFNADVMIAVAAGNSGTNSGASNGSQGAANGIAVAAINANSHTMASFSTRGPLPSGRLYPDIAACGVSTVMAKRDAESSNSTGSGTSMASPMVCGAATLIRSANAQLTALETKAILLAATQDISQEHSNWDRNSYGMGMMRADLATEMALGQKGSVTSASLQSGSTTWTRSFTLNANKSYAFATTWHRDPNKGSSWSDLEVELLDPNSNVVARADSPLNLYEVVRSFVRTSGQYTLRVRAKSLQAGITNQDFAVAMTEVATKPIRGEFTSYGQGCAGSGTQPNHCASLNPNGGSLTGSTRSYAYAYQGQASTAMSVVGFDLYTQTTGAASQTVPAEIYLGSGSGPSGSAIASTTMTVGATAGFYSAVFGSPVNIPSGATFYVTVTHNNSTIISSLSSGTGGAGYYNSNGSWRLSTIAVRPSFRVLCQGGGGSGAVPRLSSQSTPEIAKTLQVDLSQAANQAPAVLLIGISKQSFGNLQLPYSLASLGAAGCDLLASGDMSLSTTTNSQGVASINLPFPNDKSLVGLVLYDQFAVLDGAANALGLAMSNGVSMLIGGQP